jgi:hypothetical protein
VELELTGHHYLARTELHGHAHVAFRAVGLRPPPRVQPRTEGTRQM